MKEPRIKIMGLFVKIITFGWAAAITLAPFGIYVRREHLLNQRIANHEKIHWQQQFEMLIIFFYLWYLIEWLIKAIIRIPFRMFAPNSGILKESAYNSISFEREAHDMDDDLNYLEKRKHYAWIKRVFK